MWGSRIKFIQPPGFGLVKYYPGKDPQESMILAVEQQAGYILLGVKIGPGGTLSSGKTMPCLSSILYFAWAGLEPFSKMTQSLNTGADLYVFATVAV